MASRRRNQLKLKTVDSKVMSRFNKAQCKDVIGWLQADESQTVVAAAITVSQSTISRLLERHHQHCSTNDRNRSGRPRVTTAAQDRVHLRHLRDRLATATATVSAIPGQRRISVRNRRRDSRIRVRRPVKAVVLKLEHRWNRLQWAQA